MAAAMGRFIVGIRSRSERTPGVGPRAVPRPTPRRPLLAASTLAVVALLCSLLPGSPAIAQQPIETRAPAEYTVLLEAPSVGQRMKEAREAGTTVGTGPRPRAASSPGLMRRAVVRTQDPVIAALVALDVQVLGSAHNVLNAVFVRATDEEAAAIREIPGVKGVVRGQRYEPMLKSVSRIVQVSAARIRPTGTQLFGEGVKIGIIDSGLDFDHEAFSDPTLTSLEGYPRGDPQYIDLASTKVIVVRSYVHLLNSRIPVSSTPDDDSPWDLSGHGTAVSMIAAGKRIDTPLGPVSGIAPKARLGVYKVFGSPGLNFYTADHTVIAALDDAVDDGMDIVNLSLGNPVYYPWNAVGRDCGRRSPEAACNPLAFAAQSVVEDFDIVVVAAAGNHGFLGIHPAPAKSTIISPGSSPGVITVGGTGNAAALNESVRIGERTFSAATGTGPEADGPLTASAVLASELTDAQGCEPYPDQSLVGKIAVVDRGECFFVDKVENADAAGAAGVLVINHEGDDLVTMALLQFTDIPGFFVGEADGAIIRELLADPGNPLTLEPTPTESEQPWAYVAARSSRGPNLALLPKPDLVAPGLEVYTAAPRHNDQGTLFTPSGFRTISGTSFAAPVVTGAAAIISQAYPSFTARQVASALINSASSQVLENGEPARLTSAGAGVLDIAAALRPNATAVPPSIGFGSVEDAAFPIRRRLVIANKAKFRQSYWMRAEPRDADANARVTIGGRRAAVFRLGPGETTEVDIVLEGSRPAPGLYEGRLRLTSLMGFGSVSIPYMYAAGDNEPFDALRFRGRFETGVAGEASTESVVARVVDQFGVPVVGRRVEFSPGQESTSIQNGSRVTGPTGLIFARVRFHPDPGDQVVVASVGQLKIPFLYNASGTRPEIASIANSANPGAAEGIAPGSLVTIAGSSFAQFPSGPAPTPQIRRLPLSRKGVTVAFDAPGIDVSEPGRFLSVEESSLTVQVPWELDGATHAYVKVRASKPSEPVRFSVAEAAPGIFSFASGDQSFAAALRFDGTVVTVGNPAVAGRAVTITMTGNGPVESTVPTGAVSSLLNSTVHSPVVVIGGESAAVTYSGLDPGMAGLYLVTAVVPASLPSGNHPLRVEINSVSSNEVLLPVQ